MITKNELTEKFKKSIRESPDPSKFFTTIFSENLMFIHEHYTELDDETKKFADEQFEMVGKINDEWVESTKKEPDSLLKRKILRLHRKTKSSHFDVENLLSNLEKKSSNSDSFTENARELFIFICQISYNYLCDVTENSVKGGINLAYLNLFYSSLDEACVSFFLASHSFAPQSMSHTRNIQEAINLISLFQKDIKYVDCWASKDYKERKKVSPQKVREILGKKDTPEEDAYWLLSEIGSHPSFKNIQTKTAQKIINGNPTHEFRITVGGVLNKFHTEQALVVCLIASMELLNKIAQCFEQYLLKEEIDTDLKTVLEKIKEFLAKNTNFPNVVIPTFDL